LFTTEAHTRFTYQGGEKFTFYAERHIDESTYHITTIDLSCIENVPVI
jgi:hypothetical protein